LQTSVVVNRHRRDRRLEWDLPDLVILEPPAVEPRIP
jgi:hypothetical protein